MPHSKAYRKAWRAKNKEKTKSYMKIWRKRNKDELRIKAKNKRKRNQKWLRDYKETLKCSHCPETHPATLDFHHKDENKEFGVAWMIRSHSIENIKKEIAKCIVLCSNCHRKEHYNDYSR